VKKIILVSALLCSFTIFAQNKIELKDTAGNDRLEEWMNRISSDPGMRADMVAMMVYKTKDNKEELMKFAELFTRYPELNKMILEKMPRNANRQYTLEPRGTDNNSKLIEIKPVEAMPKK
jgi:hypothetical protein